MTLGNPQLGSEDEYIPPYLAVDEYGNALPVLGLDPETIRLT